MRNKETYSEFLRNSFILLGSTMSVMAGASIAPALPEMKAYFQDLENAEMLVKIMLTVPSLFIALFSPLAGIVLDKFGRKAPLILATILYGVAGTSGFFLNDLYAILVGRAFLGISVAVIMVGYITVAGDLFSGAKLNKFMGLQASFMSFGGVLFLMVGGFLADIHWHHPFLIYLFAFIILPGLVLFLKETKRVGAIRKKANLFVTEVFHKTVPVYIIAFLGMTLFLMIPVQLPFLLKETNVISNTNVGLLMSMWIFFSAITSLAYKRVRAKLNFYEIFSLAFLIWCIGYLGLAASDDTVIIIVALALAGIGNGLVLPNTKVLLITLIPEEFRARAVGVLTMGFYFGQFFSPIIFSFAVYDATIQLGFLVYGMFMLLLSVSYFLIRNRD